MRNFKFLSLIPALSLLILTACGQAVNPAYTTYGLNGTNTTGYYNNGYTTGYNNGYNGYNNGYYGNGYNGGYYNGGYYGNGYYGNGYSGGMVYTSYGWLPQGPCFYGMGYWNGTCIR